MYDVIIGNIPDARDPKDPDMNWSRSTANVVLTRPQACNAGKKTKSICVPDNIDTASRRENATVTLDLIRG